MRQEVLTLKGVNANNVIERFCDLFQPVGRYIVGNNNIHVCVIEKYYYRISADVAAMVLFEHKKQNQLVVHIAIAGGSDMFGVSLGAQNSMLKKIIKFFDELSD